LGAVEGTFQVAGGVCGLAAVSVPGVDCRGSSFWARPGGQRGAKISPFGWSLMSLPMLLAAFAMRKAMWERLSRLPSVLDLRLVFFSLLLEGGDWSGCQASKT
jgi:hypothetical protein